MFLPIIPCVLFIKLKHETWNMKEKKSWNWFWNLHKKTQQQWHQLASQLFSFTMTELTKYHTHYLPFLKIWAYFDDQLILSDLFTIRKSNWTHFPRVCWFICLDIEVITNPNDIKYSTKPDWLVSIIQSLDRTIQKASKYEERTSIRFFWNNIY